MSAVAAVLEGREAFRAHTGAPLTYTVFGAAACVRALQDFPVLNSSIVGDQIVFKPTINLGMAVALPDTDELIVPVVRGADNLSLARSRAIDARYRHQGANAAASARGRTRRNVYADQPRRLRRHYRHADFEPAAGGHSQPRRSPQTGRRRGRYRRGPADDGIGADLRSPRHRWHGGISLSRARARTPRDTARGLELER